METTTTDKSRLDNALNNSYEFKMGQYISTGFDIFKKEPWMLMGFLVLYVVISGVVSNIIPKMGTATIVVSTLVSACISVPLSAGFYIFANKVHSGSNSEFGDFFSGYKKFTPLMLNYFVKLLIMLLIFSPVIIYLIFSVGILSQIESAENPVVMMTQLMATLVALPVVIILFFVSMIIALYFGIGFMFSNMLIVFNGLEFMDAIKQSRKIINKKWFSFFGFIIVIGLINVLGVLCLFFGILVTAPATTCALYAAYNDIAGGTEKAVDSDLTSDILDA